MCLEDVFPQSTQSGPDPILTRGALERMFRFWRSRRLLVTSEGRLGAGPAAMLQGDELFILFGSDVPLVLRPYGDGSYQVVGCCYIQGYMEGEALHDIQEGIRTSRSIDIC